MILTEKKLGPQRHASLVITVSTTNPNNLSRVPACTRGMVDIAESLLTPAAEVGSGLADRRIVFQFPAGGIHSHVQKGVLYSACGQLASSSIDVGVLSLGTRGEV
jgi:hypothetical protein